MTHEQRITLAIEQLAVHEVVTGSANLKETVFDKFHVSAYVTKLPVCDAINWKKINQDFSGVCFPLRLQSYLKYNALDGLMDQQ